MQRLHAQRAANVNVYMEIALCMRDILHAYKRHSVSIVHGHGDHDRDGVYWSRITRSDHASTGEYMHQKPPSEHKSYSDTWCHGSGAQKDDATHPAPGERDNKPCHGARKRLKRPRGHEM